MTRRRDVADVIADAYDTFVRDNDPAMWDPRAADWLTRFLTGGGYRIESVFYSWGCQAGEPIPPTEDEPFGDPGVLGCDDEEDARETSAEHGWPVVRQPRVFWHGPWEPVEEGGQP